MKRICEVLTAISALAPASVAASTETPSSYLDASGYDEIDFHVQLASLASGKKLTVAVYEADNASGTSAAKVEEAVFTAGEAMTGVIAVVSVPVTAARKRYLAVKIQHDSAAAVLAGVSAVGRNHYRPAGVDWELKI